MDTELGFILLQLKRLQKHLFVQLFLATDKSW